jgi:hypothetical protein
MKFIFVRVIIRVNEVKRRRITHTMQNLVGKRKIVSSETRSIYQIVCERRVISYPSPIKLTATI